MTSPIGAPAALPLLSEVPLRPQGYGRNLEEFLRIGLIPSEDADLRAKAVAFFVDDERDANAAGGLPGFEARSRLIDLASVPALTPGGVAWKLAQVLSYFVDEERREWWHYLLNSALVDAVDLERARIERRVDGGRP